MMRALPIGGGSQARRIAWSSPPNQFTLPFLKLMREGNRTRRVLPVNPYVEVFTFRDTLLGLLHPNCDGGTDVWSWLILGPRAALLIGTGFGLGDTAALVAQLAGGLPVTIVNTHAARDQVLGNGRFDRVHAHEHDIANIRRIARPDAWNSMFDAAGRNRWYAFDRKDLPRRTDHQLTAIRDGHIFDLGEGYRVEAIWTGGPTPGHLMLLDHQMRCLFPGDGVSSDTIRCGIGPLPGLTHGRYANLTVFRDRLGTVIERMGTFDYLFPAHGMVNLENHLLHDMRDALDAAIAQPDPTPFSTPDPHPGRTCASVTSRVSAASPTPPPGFDPQAPKSA